jgi:hypothetical protein
MGHPSRARRKLWQHVWKAKCQQDHAGTGNEADYSFVAAGDEYPHLPFPPVPYHAGWDTGNDSVVRYITSDNRTRTHD